jgi:hypothetical protein
MEINITKYVSIIIPLLEWFPVASPKSVNTVAMEHLPEGLSLSALHIQKCVLYKEHQDDVIWGKSVLLKTFHCGLERGTTLIGTKLHFYIAFHLQ